MLQQASSRHDHHFLHYISQLPTRRQATHLIRQSNEHYHQMRLNLLSGAKIRILSEDAIYLLNFQKNYLEILNLSFNFVFKTSCLVAP